jgi:Zn-dependent alcohol dehydrogenase
VLVFVPSCGHCMPCAEGRPALCEPGADANAKGVLLSGARRLHHNHQDVHHHVGVSAFADHAVVSRRSCVKIDSDIDPAEAALFGCAVLTGVGALASGAREVIAIDLHDSKLEIARSLGATATVNARDPDAVEKVKALTRGGVDYAFEMAGSVQAMEAAYRMTRRGGTTVTAGLPPPGNTWALQQVSLVAEERTVKGSYIGSCVPSRDIPRYIGLYRAGKLPINKLMGERMPLADINRGFDRLEAGESLRDLIIF